MFKTQYLFVVTYEKISKYTKHLILHLDITLDEWVKQIVQEHLDRKNKMWIQTLWAWFRDP